METVTKVHELASPHADAMLSADNSIIDQRLRESAGDQELLRAQARFSEMISAGGIHFEGRNYPVSLRALVLDPQVERGVIAVSERLVSILDTAAMLYCTDRQVRDCFPSYDSVTRFITPMPNLAPLARICRLDGIFDTEGRYRIVETNTEGPGGVIQTGLAARIWAQAENPLTSGLNLNVYWQPLVANPDCFVHELLSTHRELTAQCPSRAAVVNFRGRYKNEVDWITRGLNNLGVETTVVDAADLRRKSGRLVDSAGATLDLVYNKLDVRDLIDESTVEEYLTATANQEATCINPWIAQWILTDKAILAVLSDDRFAGNFTPAEQELIKAHVPWTRFVRDRSTTDKEGRRVDLLSYAVAKRDELVLKPSNATRGEGVKIGRLTEPNEWADGLRHAAGAEPHVLQEYIPAPRLNALNPGSGKLESMLFGLDAFVFGGHFAGFHARASLDPVINVGKRGIIMPVAVTSPGARDRLPTTDYTADAPAGELLST
jgi:glutathionylspermidine synthase-like protein